MKKTLTKHQTIQQNVKYNDLINDTAYSEILSVNHAEIKSVVLAEIENNLGWARIANMYQITGVLAFVLGTFKAFMPFFVTREYVFLLWLGIGLLFTFSVLIALHELIHVAAYKLIGAKNLSFGFIWHKFLFFVQSDYEVLNYKQFKFIALAPAVVVGIVSFLGMIIFYNQPPFFFFLPIFAFHSIFCSGDFGLLCFFQNRPELEIVTFDVKSEGKAYFYGKKINE